MATNDTEPSVSSSSESCAAPRPDYRKAYLKMVSRLRRAVENTSGQALKWMVKDILADHEALAASEEVRKEDDPLAECASLLSLLHERGAVDYDNESVPDKHRVEKVLAAVSRELDW
jgi:hypothetical protein